MSADTGAIVAAAVAAGAAVVSLAAAVVLSRRVTQLRGLVEQLQADTVPLVRQARVVVDQAATEMERVGDVLGSAEAVTATVDSASRLAYRAFANPVVAILAFGSGLAGGLRRLFGAAPRPLERGAARPAGNDRSEQRTATARHRRRRKVAERRAS